MNRLSDGARLRLTSLPNFAYLPQFVAHARGFFADEGLAPELVTHTGLWSGLIDAAGRQADVVVGNMLFAQQQVRQPNMLVPIAYCLQQTRYWVCAAPGRTTESRSFAWRDLVGAAVIVPTDVPTPWIAFREALRIQGVSLDEVRAVVGYSSREAAEDLLAGAVEYAVLDIDRIELSGLRGLASLAAVIGAVPWSVYFATRADVAARPAVFRGFQRAIDRALRAIHDTPDDALADLVGPWFTTYDQPTARRIIASHRALSAWPPTAAIPRDHVEHWHTTLTRWGLLSTSTPLDDLLDFVAPLNSTPTQDHP